MRVATERRDSMVRLAKRKLLASFSLVFFNLGLSLIYLLSNASLERTNHVRQALGDKQNEIGNFFEIKNAIYIYYVIVWF